MSENLPLSGLAVALSALRLLTADFGHLPAPTLDVSTVFPNRLRLAFHDGLSGFEAWREALEVPGDDVLYSEQEDGRTRVLKARVAFAGADLELIGYADVYQVDGGAA
ncbi:hypothetical protein [Streptomyces odontomachi]|uniref:hypothetical protein n=1 Tax=Streptomyces odontomachi TaxID=2944940 RepID=UPI00210B3000|nr:hypothetical protein [Streptomyces sp. ODS25]